jgi:hypothetical protein
VAGQHAYFIDPTGLRIIDFSNLAQPVEVGLYQAIDPFRDLTVSGKMLI